jgi:hypothetical protein
MGKTDNNTCPLCLGTGSFEMPYRIKKDDLEVKKYLANHMRDKGYSIRQIMRVLGYKSPLSISLLLKKPNK